jgi:hypothetical protein
MELTGSGRVATAETIACSIKPNVSGVKLAFEKSFIDRSYCDRSYCPVTTARYSGQAAEELTAAVAAELSRLAQAQSDQNAKINLVAYLVMFDAWLRSVPRRCPIAQIGQARQATQRNRVDALKLDASQPWSAETRASYSNTASSNSCGR